MKRGKILAWVAVLAVCVAVAVLLARWWAGAAEERFGRHLRSAPLEELQRLAQGRDWDPMLFYWLGARLTAEGRDREATAALARSVALNPRSAAAHAALGVALGRTGRPQEAEAELKQALGLDARMAFAHFALGSLYHRYKRWQQGAEQLEAAAASN